MSTLPLVIAGQTVGLGELAGYNYLSGYPELMTLLIQHCQDPANGYALSPAFIYPFPGKQKIYAQQGRSWQQGQRLRAAKIGLTTNWRTVIVHNYLPLTGELWIEVMASSVYESAQVGSGGWYLTPYFSEPIGAALVAIANGGTAAATVDDARVSLQLPLNTTYQTFFSDFIFPDCFCRNIYNNVDQGAAVSYDAGTNLSIDFSAHPGLMKMQTQISTDVQQVSFGKAYNHHWADMSGDNSVFESLFHIPALSTSGTYQFETGLIGTNAKISLSYKDTLNAGSFQYVYGTGGAYTTTNTAVLAAINTWYKFTVVISGANVQMTINGASSTTTAKAAYQGVGTTNRMTPMARLTQAASALSPLVNLDYLYYRKFFPSGR